MLNHYIVAHLVLFLPLIGLLVIGGLALMTPPAQVTTYEYSLDQDSEREHRII